MSQILAISDELAEVAALVRAGKKAQAKRRMSVVLDKGETELLSVVGRCATTLETYPHAIAVEKLRDAYRATSNPAYRAVIVACVPAEDNGQYIRRTETRFEQDPNRWPDDLTTRVDETQKKTKKGKKAKRAQRQAEQNAKATQYLTERGGVVDGPQIADREDRAEASQVYGSGLDYDKAAVHAQRGFPCLLCRCERAAYRKDGGDSGLCENCETPWRKGLAQLAEGYTRADVLQARCEWLAAQFPRPRGVLVAEWRSATGTGDRDVIEAWISDHKAERPTCDECLSRNGVAPLEIDEGGAPVDSSPLVCVDCRKQAEAEAEPVTAQAKASEQHDTCDRCGRPGAPFQLCDGCDKQADAEAAMQATIATEPGGCEGCGSLRQVRQGLCVGCRKLADEAEHLLTEAAAEPPAELVGV